MIPIEHRPWGSVVFTKTGYVQAVKYYTGGVKVEEVKGCHVCRSAFVSPEEVPGVMARFLRGQKMQVKTRELTGTQLEWVITGIHIKRLLANGDQVKAWFIQGHAEGHQIMDFLDNGFLLVEALERERICTCAVTDTEWEASKFSGNNELERVRGSTLAEAAMRCWALLSLGETVEVPDALVV